MATIDAPRPMQRGTGSPACCSDAPCGSGLRNRYFRSKRLTADAFSVEQAYLLERRRLLNRAIHGWGVVYGYAVQPEARQGDGGSSGRLEIGLGLALDACGRELVQVRPVTIGVDDVILLDAKGAVMDRPPEGSYLAAGQTDPNKQAQTCWLLSAHYTERKIGPVTVADACSCERQEWEQVCETVRYSLRRVACSECCEPHACELECDCVTGPCCEQHATQETDQGDRDRSAEDVAAASRAAGSPVRRGGCQCLCRHLSTLSLPECGPLREVDEPCGRVAIDLCSGVALACVRLKAGDCEDWQFDAWVEACGPRRLVKRNDLLFDLIRGCDLTHISAIGWGPWHRSTSPVGWEAFKDSFGTETPPDSGRNPTSAYWVEFSRPVRKDTVRSDCFSMTIVASESEAGWGEVRRVPIIDVETIDAPGPQTGLINRATLVVDSGWVSDAILSRKRIFNQNQTTVEIEIRGDFIVDCNGQAVDANAVGRIPAPTGNGTPGGTFYSSFNVEPSGTQTRVSGHDGTNTVQGV